MKLDRGPLFETLAIAVKKGEAVPFYLTDGFDGFYEGRTFQVAEGLGYQVHGRAVFRDYLSWRGHLPNPRDMAESARLYPGSVRHVHSPTMWDEIALPHRRRAVALRLHSDRADHLALAPLLAVSADDVQVQVEDGVALIGAPRGTLFIAAASLQLFRAEPPAAHETLFAPVFRTAQPENEFTLYLAFASTAERALDLARRLREQEALEKHLQGGYERLVRSHLWTADEDYSRALLWAKHCALTLLVGDEGEGFWRGLPYHRHHRARESLRAFSGGLLATGLFGDARELLRRLAGRQAQDPKSPEYGLLPDFPPGHEGPFCASAETALLYVRAVAAFARHTGDLDTAGELFPTVGRVIEGTLRRRTDDDGLLVHGDGETWMDARLDPVGPTVPRGTRAVEIQALWHAAFADAAALARHLKDTRRAAAWDKGVAALRKVFLKSYWSQRKRQLADRLAAADKPDYRARPNGLLAAALGGGLLEDATRDAVVKRAVHALLLPHGLLSLAPDDPLFHPRHDECPQFHREAARHNGVISNWTAGPAIEALAACGQHARAWALANAVAKQILTAGARGMVSEVVDPVTGARGRTVPSGDRADAQAAAEFVRVGYEILAGFRPDLLAPALRLTPVLPEDCDKFSGSFAFGRFSRLVANFTREKGRDVWIVTLEEHPTALPLVFRATVGGKTYGFERRINPGDTVMLVGQDRTVMYGINGRWEPKPLAAEPAPAPKPWPIAKLPADAGAAVMKEHDVLRTALGGPPPEKKTPAAPAETKETKGTESDARPPA